MGCRFNSFSAYSHYIFKYIFGKSCKVLLISKLASLAFSMHNVLSVWFWQTCGLAVALLYFNLLWCNEFFEMFIRLAVKILEMM